MGLHKKIRLADIAEKAGVSIVTVSKALAGKDGVGSALREKIWQLATELGYEVKQSAVHVGTGTVGILIPERFLNDAGSFYWNVYGRVSAELLKQNYNCVMEVLSLEYEKLCQLPVMVQDRRISGMIILGQIQNDYIRVLSGCGVPFVFLDFYYASRYFHVDAVVSDNYYDMFLLTEYVIEQGYRNLRFVGTFFSTSSIQDRFFGFMKAMTLHNLPVSLEDIINDRDENGTFIPLQLPDDLPEAFICNSDVTARRVIAKLAERGISVPGDIAVTGFDNYLSPEYSIPDLTTVAVDTNALARVAADIIVKKISGQSYTAGRNLISGKLIIRNSVLNKK